MANPFDQFDSAHASGGNPFDQFDTGAKAAPAQTDASSKMSGIGRTLENALTLGGADWLYSKVPGMPSLQTQQAQTEAARQSVPAAIRYPAEIGAYAVGPGKLLGPAAAAVTGGPIAAGVAEGAMAGGLSSGFGSNFDPGSTATGAATGGVLGGVAGGIGKGVAKLGATPGSVDPVAAIAKTKQLRDEAYAPLKNIAFNPGDVLNAHTGVTLTPGMAADVSSGMQSMLGKQRDAIQSGGNTANDIADYMTNLKSVSGSPSASNGDKLLAGQTASNLSDLLTNANPITDHAPGEAAQTLQQAQTAHQQYMMAQNLAEWQRRESVGASVGQAPLTEAEKYYQGPDALQNYKTLTDLYQKSQDSTSKLSWALGHMGAHAIGAAGGMMAGWPGEFIGEGLGYLFAKPAINRALKGYDKTQLLKAYQQAYPQLTGQPLTGAQSGPEVGDAIKNIMLGSAY
jgi:hypothetical protein